MTARSQSIFTKMVNREIPAEILFENERLIVIRDIAPQAPLHLLVIPKTDAYANVTELSLGDPQLLAEVVTTAHNMATLHSNGDYRLVFNSGLSAGQTVFHVHAHVLSGGLEEHALA
jgi:histidine triad (HIT) family protein